jgi:glycolate oxidase iron-sulfur subunit
MPETAPSRPAGTAPLVALADRCVQCGLCLPHCPTYRLDASETESPRGRIAYMKAVATGALAPTPLGDLHLDHCLGCRRCEGACPAGVEYGAMLLAGRTEVFSRRPPGAGTRRRLWLLSRPRLLGGLLGAYRRLHRWLPAAWRPLPRPPSPGPAVAAAGDAGPAIFVGCIAGPYEAPAREALFRLASAAGRAVAHNGGQTCCGAAAAHAGDAAGAARLARANREAFAGSERVLCLASGCQPTLAAALNGVATVEDAAMYLEGLGEGLQFRSAGGRRVAWHRPCSQFALPGSIAATRRLLARVPELRVVELPDTGCCGAAGLHMMEFPGRAQALRLGLHDAIAQAGAEEVLSANLGCRLHLDDGKLPVRHPIELLAEFLA